MREKVYGKGRRETMHRKFGIQNQAVAGVIEALLMVALVSIVLSLIQLIYIPQVMEQRESEHMDLVSNQISSLKSMIDLQGITHSSAPITTMMTLGSKDLPYFITAKAFGGLSVVENPEFKITMNPPSATLPLGTTPLTSFQYIADNSYFIDQSFILEGGGLIIQQPDGKPVMRADPSIVALNNTNTITINFNLAHLKAYSEKNMTYGEGICFIRTNYSSNKNHIDNISLGGYIRIYTAYPNAWNESLYNLMGIYAIHGYIHISEVIAQPTSYIEITPGTKSINFQLNVIEIFVQIGQGWVG